jgi:hypothetical protein
MDAIPWMPAVLDDTRRPADVMGRAGEGGGARAHGGAGRAAATQPGRRPRRLER